MRSRGHIGQGWAPSLPSSHLPEEGLPRSVFIMEQDKIRPWSRSKLGGGRRSRSKPCERNALVPRPPPLRTLRAPPSSRGRLHTCTQLACPTPPNDRETSPRKDTPPGGWDGTTRRGDARSVALGPVRSERCYRRATQKQNATDETPLLRYTLTNRYSKQSIKLR